MKPRFKRLYSSYGYKDDDLTFEELLSLDYNKPGIEITAEISDWSVCFMLFPSITITRYYFTIDYSIGPLSLQLYVRFRSEEEAGAADTI